MEAVDSLNSASRPCAPQHFAQIESSLEKISRAFLRTIDSLYVWIQKVCKLCKHLRDRHTLRLRFDAISDFFAQHFAPHGFSSTAQKASLNTNDLGELSKRFDPERLRLLKNFIDLEPLEQRNLKTASFTIEIDWEGNSTSFNEKGQKCDADENMQKYLEAFLERAFLTYMYSLEGRLAIHPLVVKYYPERVLHYLVQDPTCTELLVTFLDDQKKPLPGIDDGGLSRQLWSDLIKYLLDETPSRKINIEKSSSLFELVDSQKTDGQSEILQDLGKAFYYALAEKKFVVGRILPDDFFKILQEAVSLIWQKSSKDQVLRAIVDHLVPQVGTKEQKRIFEIYSQKLVLTQEDVQIFEALEISCHSPKRHPWNAIHKYLFSCYRGRALACYYIARGFAENGESLPKGAKVLGDLFNHSFNQVSEIIQGAKFNRSAIVQAVGCAKTSSTVVRQKTKWLKEFLLEESQEWVEQFLFIVTGQRVINRYDQIIVEGFDRRVCVAHTCSKSLQVPEEHVYLFADLVLTDREKFKQSLCLTMSQTSFDTA